MKQKELKRTTGCRILSAYSIICLISYKSYFLGIRRWRKAYRFLFSSQNHCSLQDQKRNFFYFATSRLVCLCWLRDSLRFGNHSSTNIANHEYGTSQAQLIVGGGPSSGHENSIKPQSFCQLFLPHSAEKHRCFWELWNWIRKHQFSFFFWRFAKCAGSITKILTVFFQKLT